MKSRKYNSLIKSFTDVFESIKRKQCIWVDTPTGSVHLYNKELVNMKLKDISNFIYYLQKKQEEEELK